MDVIAFSSITWMGTEHHAPDARPTRPSAPQETAQMALETWNIDNAHSSIGFTVRHMVVAKVHGQFSRWTAQFRFDPLDVTTSSVVVEIDAASITTHEEKRDAHLRSGDFLAVAEHPKLTFRSRRVEPVASDRFRIVGELTIRGVTRDVVLDAENLGTGKDPWGNTRVGFTAKVSINRMDFGAKWNAALEAGGVLVGEKVDIEIDLEAVRAAAQHAA
jgi:polyisoprenoid-binding protein YceI